ncbi:MAG: sulfite exporter TauE/SafE family protein [Gammaproteobacteria bacterium]
MAIIFGILVGLALGLTGGGGSAFALPLLIYGLGMATKDAVVVSLAAVALTSAFGAVTAWRAGLVEWRPGIIFSFTGILGAPLGLAMGKNIPESYLIMGFAVLALLVAAAMWGKAVRSPAESAVVRAGIGLGVEGSGAVCSYSPDGMLRFTARCSFMLAFVGLGTGFLAGLFGVGGGFIIVPALMFITQMRIHQAVATSLFVITLIGLAGVGSELAQGRTLPWQLTGLFVAGGLAGMGAGRLLARRMAGPTLQKLFAVAIALMALFMLAASLGINPFAATGA